jgi:hypothetical protein
VSEKARKLFESGVTLLEDPTGPRYREAYELFSAAYADSPTPKILSNLGLCAMMLERDGEAITHYGRYLADVQDIDPRERAKIQGDLKVLQTGLAVVEIKVTPAGAVVNDERVPMSGPAVLNRYVPVKDRAELGLHPGKHRLRVELEGYTPQIWDVELTPGDRKSKTVVLQRPGGQPGAGTGAPTAPVGPAPVKPIAPEGPAPTDDRPTPAAVWALVGVGGAFVIGTIITGALSLDRKATYDSFADSTGGKRTDAEDIRAEGETLNTVTDVLWPLGTACEVVALIVYLARPTVAPAADEVKPTARAPRIVPTAGATGVGLSVRGEF